MIGSHGGSYALYRALAVSAGALDPIRRPDLTNTYPAETIGPFPQWSEPRSIVSLDPWGHLVAENFREEIAQGIDIRPTIAVTRPASTSSRCSDALAAGRLKADGQVVHPTGSISVVKVAIDPVWYLPGIAERFGYAGEDAAPRAVRTDRRHVPRTGDAARYARLPAADRRHDDLYVRRRRQAFRCARIEITCRVHDECNGSDVFGSDICTCRPYLIHGIEECARMAQRGGLGIIVYNRKEGRALGEVTKFLVYNARKRQEGGDAAAAYFERTECVAGVQDARFQQLMPDCCTGSASSASIA